MTDVKHPFTHLGPAPYVFTGWTKRVYRACQGAPAQPGSSCDHCGTAIMYEFWCRASDGTAFKVGCDCILKLRGRDPELERAAREERRKIRREQRRERNRARREENRALWRRRHAREAREFLAAHPGVADLFRGCKHPVLRDMARKLARYGSLSEGQLRYARSLKEQAEAPPEVFDGTFPDGQRVDVEGRVLAVKWRPGPVPWHPGVLKMLVALRDAEGREYKAWGTVPQAIDPDRGDRVAFRATFKRSDDDPHFGFFSRPAKAQVVEA